MGENRMGGRCVGLRVVAVVLLIAFGSCSKKTVVLEPQPALAAGLHAVPPTVAVGVGGVQHVAVSGGIPPYNISSGPSAIATVQLMNADSTTATLKIMGVTPATDATSITVQDNTPTNPLSITVPVSVF